MPQVPNTGDQGHSNSTDSGAILQTSNDERGHAVVLGASLGGLLAARVLSGYFQQVTIVERDQLPVSSQHRKGVPQGQHTHGLFTRGAAIMEHYFPNLMDELVADGALRGDPGFRARLTFQGHHARRVITGRDGVSLSRPLLEGHIRRRVSSLDNVRVKDGTAATGLVGSRDGQRIVGVRTRPARSDEAGTTLEADMVLDATGRGSQSPRWLDQLGYKPPFEERADIGMRYVTRLYRRQPEHLKGDRAILLAPKPPSGRGAFISAIEGLRWMVTLQDYFGERPPTDEQGFREFAATLATADLSELLAGAEPCSEAVTYNYPASQRRRYDRLQRFPLGYLVFGDALCSFNPVYGQGMTVAAIEAELLDECLRTARLDRVAERFFHTSAKPIEAAWSIAVGGDMKFPRVPGKRSASVRFSNWYMDHVFPAAEHDPAVARALLAVINFEASPKRLMRPGTALRVLRHSLRRPRADSDDMRDAIWTSVHDVLRDIARIDEAKPMAHSGEALEQGSKPV